MTRTPVISSQIASVGYDAASKKLHVEFKGGSVYEYDNVPQGTYHALMGVGPHGDGYSVGKAFGSLIKNNPAHPYRKVS
jgi:hypothetical protein